MNGYWEILGLEPTRDSAAIRRAYAQKTRTCHPEDNPDGFLKLREAYQAAMDYARRGNDSLSGLTWEQEETEIESGQPEEISGKTISQDHSERLPDHETPLQDRETGWLVRDEPAGMEENPYRGGEAIRKFTELYTGKQRRNSKAWMDYFTSDTFLDAGWDRHFTALLQEKTAELEQEFPPGREFMLWLGIAYQLFEKGEVCFDRERQRRVNPQADFEGMDSVLCIAAKGPSPKRPGGDELSVLESFKDYRHLVRMAAGGSWNGQAMEEFKWIAGRYIQAYIREHCDPGVAPDYQRHPAGLRVFAHFFQRDDLPEEIYRYMWQKFDLKNAVRGRAKIFYGSLREWVIKRIPDVEEDELENFFRLNRERAACFIRIQAEPDRAEEELAGLFHRDDLRKALHSRRFVEEQLLTCSDWLNSLTPEGVVHYLSEFYRDNRDIPGWDQVVKRAEQELANRAKERERKEEKRKEEAKRNEEAENAFPEKPDLSLLPMLPKRVYAQPLTGSELVYIRLSAAGNQTCMQLLTASEQAGEGEENEQPLTRENLSELFDRFAVGGLERLELDFGQAVLALVRDKDQYACFCFEKDNDTWYALLSQPEVYRTVDSEAVEYRIFGMGKLAGYNIHEKPESILRNLNQVFVQIGRGRIQSRMGEIWLWSSFTKRQNGSFKKRMAMQKLAKIPVSRAGTRVSAKFVFSRQPVLVESVSLAGERFLTSLRPGNYDLAAAALAQFFGRKLAKVRLSWDLEAQKGGPAQRHIVLLQEDGRFMMAWLRDDREQAGFYTSAEPGMFMGRMYPASPVHRDLDRIRNCLDLMLDDMACIEPVTDRPGEFVLIDVPYGRIRREMTEARA